jgi:dihydroorotate dehydrogenase
MGFNNSGVEAVVKRLKKNKRTLLLVVCGKIKIT